MQTLQLHLLPCWEVFHLSLSLSVKVFTPPPNHRVVTVEVFPHRNHHFDLEYLFIRCLSCSCGSLPFVKFRRQSMWFWTHTCVILQGLKLLFSNMYRKQWILSAIRAPITWQNKTLFYFKKVGHCIICSNNKVVSSSVKTIKDFFHIKCFSRLSGSKSPIDVQFVF